MMSVRSSLLAVCVISVLSSGITCTGEFGGEQRDELIRDEIYRQRRGAYITSRSNCNTWSNWINENHPSPSHRSEEERVNTTVRDAFCPVLYNGMATKFECMDGDNNITFTGNKTSSGWAQFHHCNVNDLYVMCTVADNTSTSQCPDMSVRFYCHCDPITTSTTGFITFPTATRTKAAPISTSTPTPPTTSTSMSSTITSTTWLTDSTTVTFSPIVSTRRLTTKRKFETPTARPFLWIPATIPSTKAIVTPLVTSTNVRRGETPTAVPGRYLNIPRKPSTTSTPISSTKSTTPWWTDSTTVALQPIVTTRGITSKPTARTPSLGFPVKSTTVARSTLKVKATMDRTNLVTNTTNTDIKLVENNSSVSSSHSDMSVGEDEICYYYEPASGFDVGSTHISWWIINLVISIILFCIGCTALWCLYRRLRKRKKKRKSSSVLPM